MEEESKPTIEIIEPAAPVSEEKASVQELRDAGVSEAEIESARKLGIAEEKAPEEKTKVEPEEKKGEEAKPEGDKKEELPTSTTADEYARMMQDSKFEDEKLKGFRPHEKGTYFAMKKERQKRQTLEIQAQHAEIKLKAAKKELEDLRKKYAAAAQKIKEVGVEGESEEILEETETPDQKEEKEKIDRDERSQIVRSRLAEAEIDAKSRYPDYDKAVELTTDLIKNVDKLYENPREKARIKHKLQELLWATANADKFGEGEYGPADMAYEIGRLHPDYKAPDAGGDKTGKQDGGLSPEETRRVIENSRKRTSASISGGTGKRIVTYDDLTLADAARMPSDQYEKLPKEVRERLLRT